MNIGDSASYAGENPAILGYNQKDYKERYSCEFITGFNHGSMAQGPVDVSRVKTIVNTLNQRVGFVTMAVGFKEEPIESKLVGGSCSSIALRVSHVALEFLQKSKNDSKGLIQCVKNIVEEINALNPSGRKEVRNVQAAFNAIHVKTAVQVNDICQDKVKALAAFYEMTVCRSTDELLIEEIDSCKEKFDETIKKLGAGVHLVRILQKENNHKLETQGHSTIYIKDEHGTELYFDTQLGLYELSKAPDLIYRSICSAKRRFTVDTCKFHQLLIQEKM